MPAPSAGLLLYRLRSGVLELLLVHPGGPMWAKRDQSAWSIPKGEYHAGEDPLIAARREFEEELGSPPPDGAAAAIALGEVRQRSGKRVLAWAMEGDLDAAAAVSNTCEIEWPPRSGRRLEIPEVDRAEWFEVGEARRRLNAAQVPFIERLERSL